MMTLHQWLVAPATVPATTAWVLADLGELRGRQDLYVRQAPQRLRVLREHALIESAVSSTRLEGVEVDRERIRPVVLGRERLRDRDEEEVRGYRDALNLIHERSERLSVSEEAVLQLHRLAQPASGDAGCYKERDSDIIEKQSDGRVRLRFRPVAAASTPGAVRELVALWQQILREQPVHPLVAVAAFNLDFLCIHPFRDGNGRVSRLLLLIQLYDLGYQVGRYISLERLIEQHKERYYETLEQSSQGWHEGSHDPWPYVNFVLFVVKRAYREFEERLGQVVEPRGAKTDAVQAAIRGRPEPFRVADIQRACPGVSVDLIRRTLKRLRAAGRVECLGRGQQARWRRSGTWTELGNTGRKG